MNDDSSPALSMHLVRGEWMRSEGLRNDEWFEVRGLPAGHRAVVALMNASEWSTGRMHDDDPHMIWSGRYGNPASALRSLQCEFGAWAPLAGDFIVAGCQLTRLNDDNTRTEVSAHPDHFDALRRARTLADENRVLYWLWRSPARAIPRPGRVTSADANLAVLALDAARHWPCPRE